MFNTVADGQLASFGQLVGTAVQAGKPGRCVPPQQYFSTFSNVFLHSAVQCRTGKRPTRLSLQQSSGSCHASGGLANQWSFLPFAGWQISEVFAGGGLASQWSSCQLQAGKSVKFNSRGLANQLRLPVVGLANHWSFWGLANQWRLPVAGLANQWSFLKITQMEEPSSSPAALGEH